jgi:hypothetical protein
LDEVDVFVKSLGSHYIKEDVRNKMKTLIAIHENISSENLERRHPALTLFLQRLGL